MFLGVSIYFFYCKNKENLKFCHININNVRLKFDALAEALTKGGGESKVYCRHRRVSWMIVFHQVSSIWKVLKLTAKDVTGKSGGLMMVVRGDIPQRRRPDMEGELPDVKGRIETMALEMTVKGRKWVYCSVYSHWSVMLI